MRAPETPVSNLPDPALDAVAAADLGAWRREVLAALAGPRGWWSVAGLAWADEVPAWLGSAADAELRLPERCPARVALVRRDGATLRVRPHTGVRLTVDDVPLAEEAALADGAVLRCGEGGDAVEAVVLRRADRIGLRTFDPRLGAARDPADLAWYPVTPGWVVEARLWPAHADASLPIVNVLGDVDDVPLAGHLTFAVAGVHVELLATWAGDGLFVHFRDATSGPETYGAGRFLRLMAPDAAGRTRLDFHRAVQPPCAHTPHATCPMPPLANRLPMAVRAGEHMRRPAGEEPAGRPPAARN